MFESEYINLQVCMTSVVNQNTKVGAKWSRECDSCFRFVPLAGKP